MDSNSDGTTGNGYRDGTTGDSYFSNGNGYVNTGEPNPDTTTSFAYYGFDAYGRFCAVHTYTDAHGRTYTNRTVLPYPNRGRAGDSLHAHGAAWGPAVGGDGGAGR